MNHHDHTHLQQRLRIPVLNMLQYESKDILPKGFNKYFYIILAIFSN